FRLDRPVVVAVDHVAWQVRPATIHVLEDALLANDVRVSVAKHGRATNVVPMTVTVDDVADGLVRKARVQFAFQPGGEIRADRIDQHDARWRHIDQAPPVAVTGTPEVTFDLLEYAGRSALGPGGHAAT